LEAAVQQKREPCPGRVKSDGCIRLVHIASTPKCGQHGSRKEAWRERLVTMHNWGRFIATEGRKILKKARRSIDGRQWLGRKGGAVVRKK